MGNCAGDGEAGTGQREPTSSIVVDRGPSARQRTRAGHGARGEGRQSDCFHEHREYDDICCTNICSDGDGREKPAMVIVRPWRFGIPRQTSTWQFRPASSIPLRPPFPVLRPPARDESLPFLQREVQQWFGPGSKTGVIPSLRVGWGCAAHRPNPPESTENMNYMQCSIWSMNQSHRGLMQ